MSNGNEFLENVWEQQTKINWCQNVETNMLNLYEHIFQKLD